jgi:cytochrome c5
MRGRSTSTLVSVVLLLAISLVGCLPTLGETVMPHPPTAAAPPTALPVVAPVPPPIPHSVEGAREDCLLCHAVGAVEAPPVPADSDHQETVDLCSTCHALLPEPAPSTLAPPDISHDLVGREDCLMCHKLGIALAPRIPDNHIGLPVDICQTCHLAAPGVSLPEETPEVGMLPSQVPHPVENRTDCRLCHETGVGGAPQFPTDHVDRANEVCLICHGVSLPEAMPEAEAEANAPEVPHTLDNRSDCRLCHETEVGGAPQFPADHVDRANEVCLVCHGVSLPEETPEAEAEVSAPEVPHTLDSRTDCRLCHETGVGGATQFPADHVDRSNQACLVCHEAGS